MNELHLDPQACDHKATLIPFLVVMNSKTHAHAQEEHRIDAVIGACIALLQTTYAETETRLHRIAPTSDQLAAMAQLVIESMSRSGRFYHDIHHVVDAMGDMEPEKDAIPLLAAIFHDVVYLTIDRELSEQQRHIIGEDVIHVDAETNKVHLSAMEDLVQSMDKMVRSIFSYDHESTDGSVLSRPTRLVDETNEYLSAIIAVHMLEPFLSFKHLFQVAACIEASIPFRVMEDGSTAMDSFFRRLEATTRRYADMLVDFDHFELVKTVQMAAYFANHDMGAFRAKDPQVFVDSSWRLLPEWCPRLGAKDECQLQDLLDALYLIQQRYQQMNVSIIFQSFENDPSASVLAVWKSQAMRNLEFVAGVTSVRILALCILKEYLASKLQKEDDNRPGTEFTTSAPLSLVQRVEEQFDLTAVSTTSDKPDEDTTLPRQVYQSLMTHRPWVGSWDARQCRFSVSLVANLPWETIHQASLHPTDDKDRSFLKMLPSDILRELARVIDEHK